MTEAEPFDFETLDVLQSMSLPMIRPASEQPMADTDVKPKVTPPLVPYPCKYATLFGRAFFPAYVNHTLVSRVIKYMFLHGLRNSDIIDLKFVAMDVLYTSCPCGAPTLIDKIMKQESLFDVACHVFIHGFPQHAYSFMYDAYVMMLYCDVPM